MTGIEGGPPKRTDYQKDDPELDIIPAEQPEIRRGEMPPDMQNIDIDAFIDEQIKKDDERKKDPPMKN